MNILIPDSWLRDYLKTDATVTEIKQYLSLCGPSVERINTVGREKIYDIEITTNRVDSFSIMGVAREAFVILPEFGKKAQLKQPQILDFGSKTKKLPAIALTIRNDPHLNKRILALVIDLPKSKQAPSWMAKRLELVGQRPLNAAIDITNYVMWEIGHPVHVFDFDRLAEKTIIVREAKKGETLQTLDGKTHTLQGGEVIYDDGTGRIVDLPGIMGTQNTVVTANTKRMLLWIESNDPVRIRRASMGLAIRTQAAVINEKHPDPQLALTAMQRAAYLYVHEAGGTVASRLTDIYPGKPAQHTIAVPERLISMYIGKTVDHKRITDILVRLGFDVSYEPSADRGSTYGVIPPSSRTDDVTIAEDVVEEIARIYGYHNISVRLPAAEPPLPIPDPVFAWEDRIKLRLRDWGYTEVYTYSMLSDDSMNKFGFDRNKTYKISNPLSQDWTYMRPHLFPTVLAALKQNLSLRDNLRLFELSMAYDFRPGDLPEEKPTLIVVWSGERFLEAKGLAETILLLFGLDPDVVISQESPQPTGWYTPQHLTLGVYGSVGVLSPRMLSRLEINQPVTRLYLDISSLVHDAKPGKSFTPVPKYPPVYEDLSFTVGPGFRVGPFAGALQKISRLVAAVTYQGSYENTRTFHITYQDQQRNLNADDIRPLREKLIQTAAEKFGAILKK